MMELVENTQELVGSMQELAHGRWELALCTHHHGYSRNSARHGLHRHHATSPEKGKGSFLFLDELLLTLALNVWSFCERYSSLLWSGFPLL